MRMVKTLRTELGTEHGTVHQVARLMRTLASRVSVGPNGSGPPDPSPGWLVISIWCVAISPLRRRTSCG